MSILFISMSKRITKKQRKKQNEYSLAHYYRNREKILEKLKLQRLLDNLAKKIESIEKVKEKYNDVWEQIHRSKGEQ